MRLFKIESNRNHPLPGSRMQRHQQRHRQRHFFQSPQQFLQDRHIPRIFIPVHRAEHKTFRQRQRQNALFPMAGTRTTGIRPVPVIKRCIQHHIARPEHFSAPCPDILPFQIPHSLLGRTKKQGGKMVGQHPVVLLRHGRVERTQACLHMHQGNTVLIGRQSPGQSRIRVAIDQHPVRLFLPKHGIYPYEHIPQ